MEIATIAGRQHGIVTIAQLLAWYSEATVRRRVREGRLHRVHRGVYAVGHAGLSREGIWLAAVLASGANAALSHLSAAAHWKVSRWPVCLTSVVTVSKHAPDGVDVHRTTHLDARDVTVWRGIPVTNVARMLVDLTDVLTAHQLAYVIHEAEFRRIFSERATHAAMDRARGRRGLGKLKRALELHADGSAGTRSAKEDAFLEGQLVEPLVNTRIEVDFHWPDEQRVVEVDGHGHRRQATRREDARRDAALRQRGWSVERRAS
ncbi:uncharacterized protein DUF559 [Solirubrobacter pauli]|uniref:Uncharacterized protein DUF559 n=1 Tax=Solirubrobacter pauli TaxID=166793 RepID=A0A660L0X1_9ACTN|nr:type IV toxin-antitoxin system AbiEi family antitoxin domain-containing protein [Solirubrobacter pauli]RKQ86559.1 uncharacterized protein DUF559 [Solirubrobacter pauli]